MQLDLSDEERAALTQHLHEHIRDTRHPGAASLPLLKAILVKLDPTSERDPLPETRR